MPRLPWVPWDIDRWRISDSREEFSLAERGLYREMLDYQWQKGSVPEEVGKLAQVTGSTVEEITPLLPAVLSKFDRVKGGRLVNRDMDAIKQEKASLSSKRAEANAARRTNGGGRPKKTTNETTNQQQENNNASLSISKSESPSFFQDEGFSEFSAAYPKDSGLHAVTLQHWYVEALGSSPADEHARIMAGLARMKASGTEVKYLPSAEDFLRKKRYLERWKPDSNRPKSALGRLKDKLEAANAN